MKKIFLLAAAALVLSFGCCAVVTDLLKGITEYPEPFLNSVTLEKCEEGKSIDTYLKKNETISIRVKIESDFEGYCIVSYKYEDFGYVATYDKKSGKLCAYNADSPNMHKSLSMCGLS